MPNDWGDISPDANPEGNVPDTDSSGGDEGGGTVTVNTVYVRGPFSVTPVHLGIDGTLALFVGDENVAHDFSIRQADGSPYIIPENAICEVFIVDESSEDILTSAGVGQIRDREGGRVRHVIAPAVCVTRGRKRLTLRFKYADVIEAFGPAILNVARL